MYCPARLLERPGRLPMSELTSSSALMFSQGVR